MKDSFACDIGINDVFSLRDNDYRSSLAVVEFRNRPRLLMSLDQWNSLCPILGISVMEISYTGFAPKGVSAQSIASSSI